MGRLPVPAALAVLLSGAAVGEEFRIAGKVLDPDGRTLARAAVRLLTPAGAAVAEASTSADGAFQFETVTPGPYVLRVEAAHFDPRSVALDARRSLTGLTVSLPVGTVRTQVTVAAERSAAEDDLNSMAPATVRDAGEFRSTPLTTIGDAVTRIPGVAVQQTTTGQVSPMLRGLTGYQTLLLVDGVRLNTAIFRSGPNQYLAFVDPSQADRVEAVLGPGSVNYGSDALAGTVQVQSRPARFGLGPGLSVHGDAGVLTASADASVRSDALVSISKGNFEWMAGGGHQRHNSLRSGGGLDSHNVFRRFFGLDQGFVSGMLGDRLVATGFGQYGAQSRLAIRPAADSSLTVSYQRGEQFGIRSYRDLLGGLGRLQAGFEPQILNLFYTRYEKLGVGPLSSLSGTFSVNSQRDDNTRQGQLTTDTITRDYNKVDSYGYTGQGTALVGRRWLTAFGGDVYDEHVSSTRTEEDPRSAQFRRVRAQFPNGSRYTTMGFFSQNSVDLIADRLRAKVGARYTGVRLNTYANDNLDPAGNSFGVANSSQYFNDLTFNGSLAWQVTRHIGLHALAGRGFRAPNVSDLGAIGLTGLGFEVPASTAVPHGALLAADASEGALPKGPTLASLAPEYLLNYEGGMRVTAGRVHFRAQMFHSVLKDPIVRRTLLFPAANPPQSLGGFPVTVIRPTAAQLREGVVTVATAYDPRAVKAFVNDGEIRYYGIESFLRWSLSSRWSLEGNYSYLNGAEVGPTRPPRRLEPQQGSLLVRYVPSGRRWWLEIVGFAVGKQTHLNPGDFDDERIGASRRRSDIATFFRSATVVPWLRPPAGQALGSAGDVFWPTGETLAAIQDRVLPIGSTINGVYLENNNSRVPMLIASPAFVTVEVRGGYQLAEHWSLRFGAANLADSAYRVHGSGVDGPGAGLFLGVRWAF